MLEVRSYRACAQYAYFPTICIARVHDPSVPNTVVCLCVKLSDASVATPHTSPKIRGYFALGGGLLWGGKILFGEKIIGITNTNM